jgi:hypothetical protein
MNYENFYAHIEDILTSAIRTSHPTSWDENHITFSICDAFAKEAIQVELEGLDRPFKIVWDARKLRLPEEADFGDIAVLVRLTTWAGETVEGVGFLEAKRRDLHTNKFPAATTSQLKKILRKAPYSQLLLYDYENVSSCMDNWSVMFEGHYYRRRYGQTLPFTHCVAVPTATAIQQGKYTTHLHKFGVSFSHQLIGRYFRGFDLHFDSATIAAAKGNINRNGGPRALILVGVSTGDQDPDLPDFNSERYMPFVNE